MEIFRRFREYFDTDVYYRKIDSNFDINKSDKYYIEDLHDELDELISGKCIGKDENGENIYDDGIIDLIDNLLDKITVEIIEGTRKSIIKYDGVKINEEKLNNLNEKFIEKLNELFDYIYGIQNKIIVSKLNDDFDNYQFELIKNVYLENDEMGDTMIYKDNINSIRLISNNNNNLLKENLKVVNGLNTFPVDLYNSKRDIYIEPKLQYKICKIFDILKKRLLSDDCNILNHYNHKHENVDSCKICNLLNFDLKKGEIAMKNLDFIKGIIEPIHEILTMDDKGIIDYIDYLKKNNKDDYLILKDNTKNQENQIIEIGRVKIENGNVNDDFISNYDISSIFIYKIYDIISIKFWLISGLYLGRIRSSKDLSDKEYTDIVPNKNEVIFRDRYLDNSSFVSYLKINLGLVKHFIFRILIFLFLFFFVPTTLLHTLRQTPDNLTTYCETNSTGQRSYQFLYNQLNYVNEYTFNSRNHEICKKYFDIHTYTNDLIDYSKFVEEDLELGMCGIYHGIKDDTFYNLNYVKCNNIEDKYTFLIQPSYQNEKIKIEHSKCINNHIGIVNGDNIIEVKYEAVKNNDELDCALNKNWNNIMKCNEIDIGNRDAYNKKLYVYLNNYDTEFRKQFLKKINIIEPYIIPSIKEVLYNKYNEYLVIDKKKTQVRSDFRENIENKYESQLLKIEKNHYEFFNINKNKYDIGLQDLNAGFRYKFIFFDPNDKIDGVNYYNNCVQKLESSWSSNIGCNMYLAYDANKIDDIMEIADKYTNVFDRNLDLMDSIQNIFSYKNIEYYSNKMIDLFYETKSCFYITYTIDQIKNPIIDGFVSNNWGSLLFFALLLYRLFFILSSIIQNFVVSIIYRTNLYMTDNSYNYGFGLFNRETYMDHKWYTLFLINLFIFIINFYFTSLILLIVYLLINYFWSFFKLILQQHIKLDNILNFYVDEALNYVYYMGMIFIVLFIVLSITNFVYYFYKLYEFRVNIQSRFMNEYSEIQGTTYKSIKTNKFKLYTGKYMFNSKLLSKMMFVLLKIYNNDLSIFKQSAYTNFRYYLYTYSFRFMLILYIGSLYVMFKFVLW